MPRISETMDKFLQEEALTNDEKAQLRTLIGCIAALDVDNALVNGAIEEDAAATRTSLGLGSAALADTGDFDPAGSSGAALIAANDYTDTELIYRLSALIPQSFNVTEKSQAAQNLGFKVYADRATANATEARMGVPFFNQATEFYDSTDDIA